MSRVKPTREQNPSVIWGLGDHYSSDGQSPIEAFVDAKLAESSLTPTDRASREPLIRRACFDLLGLRPQDISKSIMRTGCGADSFDDDWRESPSGLHSIRSQARPI